MTPGDPYWDRVVERHEVLLMTRAGRRRGSRSTRNTELLAALGVRDMAVAPLYGEEGVAGYLLVADRLNEGVTFDTGDGRLLEALANHAGVALENGRLIDRVAREVREPNTRPPMTRSPVSPTARASSTPCVMPSTTPMPRASR